MSVKLQGRIDPVAAIEMLQAGAHKADLARRFGVSRAAVTQRLRGLWPPPLSSSSSVPGVAPGGSPALSTPILEPTAALLTLLARREPEAAAALQQWAFRVELRPDLILVHVKASWLAREPMTALARNKATLEAAWGRPVAFRWQ